MEILILLPLGLHNVLSNTMYTCVQFCYDSWNLVNSTKVIKDKILMYMQRSLNLQE